MQARLISDSIKAVRQKNASQNAQSVTRETRRAREATTETTGAVHPSDSHNCLQSCPVRRMSDGTLMQIDQLTVELAVASHTMEHHAILPLTCVAIGCDDRVSHDFVGDGTGQHLPHLFVAHVGSHGEWLDGR